MKTKVTRLDLEAFAKFLPIWRRTRNDAREFLVESSRIWPGYKDDANPLYGYASEWISEGWFLKDRHGNGGLTYARLKRLEAVGLVESRREVGEGPSYRPILRDRNADFYEAPLPAFKSESKVEVVDGAYGPIVGSKVSVGSLVGNSPLRKGEVVAIQDGNYLVDLFGTETIWCSPNEVSFYGYPKDEIEAFLETNGWKDGGGGNNFSVYDRNGRTIYVFAFGNGTGPNDSHYLELSLEGLPIGAGFFFQEGEEGISSSARKALEGGKGLTIRRDLYASRNLTQFKQFKGG